MTKLKIFSKMFCLLLVLSLVSIEPCVAKKPRNTAPTYRTSTSFHLLQQGMSKSQFESWLGLYDGSDYIGKRPAKSHSYKKGDDVWEVWVFAVYDFKTEQRWLPQATVGGGTINGVTLPSYTIGGYYVTDTIPYIHHYEYVAFKNGYIEEWGQGEGRQYYY